MAFSDFHTISEVQQRYRIRYDEDKILTLYDNNPPETFIKDYAFYQKNLDIFTSEAARSEIIISPLLRELFKNHYTRYSFWIQKKLHYDAYLTGTPDYMFSQKSDLGKTVLENPIVIIIEAKKNDFEQGWGQCLAELVASQKLNNNPTFPVYGIVTDAILWQMGQLIGNKFIKNVENLTIDQLSVLYGTLDHLIGSIQLQKSKT
jgi:hypothetical protein